MPTTTMVIIDHLPASDLRWHEDSGHFTFLRSPARFRTCPRMAPQQIAGDHDDEGGVSGQVPAAKPQWFLLRAVEPFEAMLLVPDRSSSW